MPPELSPVEARMAGLVAASSAIAQAEGLDARLGVALEQLEAQFGHRHTMVLVPEEEERLVMLACRGYPSGGVGAEIRFGVGALGIAAERCTPVCISNVSRGLLMVRAAQARQTAASNDEIAFPGLVNLQSQLAVPASVEGRLVLVLYAEDTRIGQFFESDVQVVQILANQLAAHVVHETGDQDVGLNRSTAAVAEQAELLVRYYETDGSVFFDDEYVIKALPGRILHKLLSEYLDTGRVEFTKKELRLDPALGLPPVRDNLDTRLILLRRRLEERFPVARIDPSGRGRFLLTVQASIRLERKE